MAAKLVRASCGKSGKTSVQCDWSSLVSQVWLASNGKVEDEEGVFVLMSVDGVVSASVTGGDYDLR